MGKMACGSNDNPLGWHSGAKAREDSYNPHHRVVVKEYRQSRPRCSVLSLEIECMMQHAKGTNGLVSHNPTNLSIMRGKIRDRLT